MGVGAVFGAPWIVVLPADATELEQQLAVYIELPQTTSQDGKIWKETTHTLTIQNVTRRREETYLCFF